MIGVGIDAVDIARFRRVLARRAGLAERLFTEAERADLAGRTDAVAGLAARFAAKEAAWKALGMGLGAAGWHDVEVLRSDGGRPRLAVHRRVALRATALGVSGWHVSLTHTATTAEAVVVAE